MKKIISAALCMALIITALFSLSFVSSGSAVPTYSVTGTTVEPGESFTVPVTISNNPGLWSSVIYVYYDPALTLNSVSAGDVFTSSETSVSQYLARKIADIPDAPAVFAECGVAQGNYNATTVYFLNAEDDDNHENGTLVTPNMTAPEAPGTYTVGVVYSLDNSMNWNDEEIVFEFGSAEIVVEESTEIILGDANDDGKVNAKDITLLKRFISGVVSEDEINLANCDLNGDGKHNSRDITLIKKLIAIGSLS